MNSGIPTSWVDSVEITSLAEEISIQSVDSAHAQSLDSAAPKENVL